MATGRRLSYMRPESLLSSEKENCRGESRGRREPGVRLTGFPDVPKTRFVRPALFDRINS